MANILPWFDIFVGSVNVACVAIIAGYHFSRRDSKNDTNSTKKINTKWFTLYSLVMVCFCSTLGFRLFFSDNSQTRKDTIQECRTLAIWHMSLPVSILFFIPEKHDLHWLPLENIDLVGLIYAVDIVASTCAANLPLLLLSVGLCIVELIVYMDDRNETSFHTILMASIWSLVLSITTLLSIIDQPSVHFDVIELVFIMLLDVLCLSHVTTLELLFNARTTVCCCLLLISILCCIVSIPVVVCGSN
jgi:hypothetical protein